MLDFLRAARAARSVRLYTGDAHRVAWESMTTEEVVRPPSLRDVPPVPAPHRTVARPRLLRRLDAAARGKLTLVVAPQGYGKSVLLAQWAATRPDLGAFVSFDRVTGLRE